MYKILIFSSATRNCLILHHVAENCNYFLCNKEISNFTPQQKILDIFPRNMDEMITVDKVDRVNKVDKVERVDKV